jgi:ATP-dependent RNA circularization protein (DNA/RNA ligase family)
MECDPYEAEFKRRMERFQSGFGEGPEGILCLDPARANGAISYLLEVSCRAQNARNIELGRRALLSLPRDWLLGRIERIAQSTLDLEDEWEYRRLLELYRALEESLAQRLAARGLGSLNAEVREAAEDFLEE